MRYLALGDSFTIGTGTTPDRSFPAVLVNLVESYRPDLVTILIGANDIVAGVPEQRYRAQLRRIHERVRAGAPAAARFGLPQPDWSLTPGGAAFGDPARTARTIERFNQIAREEVDSAGGTYIDIFPLMREQMRKNMTAPDGLHPSAEAYAEWAGALLLALREAGHPTGG